jgi:UDP-N-acetylmuramoyl-tripeptide--D-alanyl-D-alanine ligase
MTFMATLARAHALLPGSTLVGDGATAFMRVHSDTRTMQPGDLYVALRGERFDGHDHLAAAQAAGAAAALVERLAWPPLPQAGEGWGEGVGAPTPSPQPSPAGGRGSQMPLLQVWGEGVGASTPSPQPAPAGGRGSQMPLLQVPDTLAALQQLSAAWRAQFALPLVAVTGSNGKTTVTQMIAAMLRAAHGEAALATAGNFNNHIGVPLTLLRLRPAHCAAVLELGMNHPGEIAQLAALAAPTVALVNNAQREHQEFMATVEAVARENGDVIAALGSSGTAVMPARDAYTPLWREMAGARRVLSFALDGAADVTAQAAWQAGNSAWDLRLHTPAGSTAATLHQAGRHNVLNALAATAAALAAGVPLAAIAAGLSDFKPVAGRSQTLALRLQDRSVTLVDDSYNANPDSVLAAIAVLASLPGPRWLILGDMGEVGSEGPRFHAEVGAAARDAGIEHVWAAGALSTHAGADRHFGTTAALLEALSTEWPAAASILVKGSRFMKMEQVVRTLSAAGQQGAAHAA